MDKNKVCCFTGHRFIPSYFDTSLISRGIDYLISRGVDTFIVGGAVGFDTLCAKAIIEARQKNPSIKLFVFAPCMGQDSKWSFKDQQTYKEILKSADFVDMPSRVYYNGCMKERNFKMVDASAYCICYFDGTFASGTGQTYRYAQKSGLTIYNLYNK